MANERTRGCLIAAAFALVLVPHGSAQAQEPLPQEPAPPSPGEPAPPVTAATPTPPSQEPSAELPASTTNPDRTIGGHQFIYPQFVDSAFVATYFGLHIRLSKYAADQLPTPIGNLDLTAVSFTQGFDLGVKLLDWLGLYASTGVRTLIGTNLRSLVYQGATYDLAGQVGAIVRLVQSERTGTQVSIRAQVGGSDGQLASLAPLFAANTAGVAVRDVLQGNLGEAIRTPVHSVSGGGMVTAAQAISPMFGLQAVAGLGYNSTFVERWDPNTSSRPTNHVRGVTYRLGLAASVDFFPKRVPIAIMAEYLLSRQSTSAQFTGGDELDLVHTLFGGVYYSGRPNLQLGLGVGGELDNAPTASALGRSERPTVTFAQFVLRYVW